MKCNKCGNEYDYRCEACYPEEEMRSLIAGKSCHTCNKNKSDFCIQDKLCEYWGGEELRDVTPLITALRESGMDCGDNGCEFADNKHSMRTNGGCMCLSDLPPTVRREILRLWRNRSEP